MCTTLITRGSERKGNCVKLNYQDQKTLTVRVETCSPEFKGRFSVFLSSLASPDFSLAILSLAGHAASGICSEHVHHTYLILELLTKFQNTSTSLLCTIRELFALLALRQLSQNQPESRSLVSIAKKKVHVDVRTQELDPLL